MSTPKVINKPDANGTILPLYDVKANKIIKNYIIAATGSGIIPVPLLSGVALTGIQFLMVRDLCRLYEVPYDGKELRMTLNAALGTVVTQLAAMATIIIPGVSAPTKGLTGAAIGGLYIATVGEFYKVHFQDGGNLENASLTDLRKYFVEEYKRGDISTSSLNPIHIVKRIFG